MRLLRLDPVADRARGLLRGLRPEPRGRRGYLAYVLLVVVCLYLVPYGIVAAGYLRDLDPALAAHVAALQPLVVAGVVLAALSVSVHDGSWRGSVRAEPAEIEWMISGPVRWPRLLLARVAATALTLSICGAALGGIAGAVSAVVRREDVTSSGTAGTAVAGAFIGLGCCAANVISQVVLPAVAARSIATALRVGAAAIIMMVVVVGYWGPEPSPPPWSRTWGWLSVVTGDAHADAGVGLVALLLSVVFGISTAVVATTGVVGVQAAALRCRAGRYDGVLAALMSADTRLAGQLTQHGPPRQPRRRLPSGVGPLSSYLWHTVTGWTRQPGPPLAGALWVAAGVLLPTLWPGNPGTAVAVLGVLLTHRGASLLLENVRLQTDDVRRSAHLPQPLASMLVRICLIGAAAAAGSAVVSIIIAANLGLAPATGSLLVAATVPAAAVGVGVTACRGQLPIELLFGAETPFGNSAPLQVALWFSQVPVVLALFTAFVRTFSPSDAGGATAAVAVWSAPAASLLFTLVMVAWLRARVAALLES